MNLKIPIFPDILLKAKPFLSATQALANEHFTIQTLKIPQALLMENAGLAIKKQVCAALKKMKTACTHIIIFCGPGNNGGDTLVAARHLLALENIKLTICLCHKNTDMSKERQEQLALIKYVNNYLKSSLTFTDDPSSVFPTTFHDQNTRVIIIDGILGSGLSYAPSGIFLEAIHAINLLKDQLGTAAWVISIDIPSGCSLEAATPLGECVRADHTITFGCLKRVHISEPTKKLVGFCAVKDIGLFNAALPNQFYIRRKNSLRGLLQPLNRSAHKGNFGHVAIIEGEKDFQGASRLSAGAALKVGAGLVTIVSRDESSHPSDIAEYMKCTARDAPSLWPRVTTLVLGPGLSTKKQMLAYAQSILKDTQTIIENIVLDADGLRLLDEQNPLQCKNLICTPHPKEAARLLGISLEEVQSDRFLAIESLGNMAINKGSFTIWVLKGATTLVYQKNSGIFAFEGDLPSLAVGGSGDLLTGAIAGLIAQALSPLAATLVAINLQVRAALLMEKRASRGILPSQLAQSFPSLLKRPCI